MEIFIFILFILPSSLKGACIARDSRNITWTSTTNKQISNFVDVDKDYILTENTVVEKPCSLVDPKLEGDSKWNCINNTYFHPSEPDRSGCRNPELETDLETAADIFINLTREPVGGELVQVTNMLEEITNDIPNLYSLLDKIFSCNLPWLEIPTPRAEIVEDIIKMLKALAYLDNLALSFLGDNFILEIQNFTAVQSFQFPSAADDNETRVLLDFGSSDLDNAVYMGVLFRVGINPAFRNSATNEGGVTSLETDAIHFSKVRGSAALKSMDIYLSSSAKDSTLSLDSTSCSVFTAGEVNSTWSKDACIQKIQESFLHCTCTFQLEYVSKLLYGGTLDYDLVLTTETTSTTTTTTSTTSTITTTISSTETAETSSSTVSNSTTISVGSTTTSNGSSDWTDFTCSDQLSIQVLSILCFVLSSLLSCATIGFHFYFAEKFLPQTYFRVIALMFIDGFISILLYITFYSLRFQEYRSCQFEEVVNVFWEHETVYKIGGFLLILFWVHKLSALISLSLVSVLEVKGRVGSFSATGWWVLYLLTTCIPLLILLLLSTLTKDSTKAFIPLLAPEFLWCSEPGTLAESSNILIVCIFTTFFILALVLIFASSTLSLFFFPRKDEFSPAKCWQNRILLLRPFSSKPYIRYVHNLTVLYMLESIILYPVLLAALTTDSTGGRSGWSFVFPILVFFHHLCLCIISFVWGTPKSKKKDKKREVGRTGVLQGFLKFKRGESKRPPGVRGTVRRDEPDIGTVQAVHNDALTTRVRGTVRRDEPDTATVQAVHNDAFTSRVRGTVRKDEPDIGTVQSEHNVVFTTRVRGTVRRDEPDKGTVQAVHNDVFTTNNLETDASEFDHQVHRTSLSMKPRIGKQDRSLNREEHIERIQKTFEKSKRENQASEAQWKENKTSVKRNARKNNSGFRGRRHLEQRDFDSETRIPETIVEEAMRRYRPSTKRALRRDEEMAKIGGSSAKY